ncbi:hypothetical protein F9K94_15520 [Brucella tritici]|uniref:MT-A70 family protein n=1 Tax=Brucella tritici TaxID=94626 RepID=A0A7V8B1D9_9HYPH|nr:MT-A70 family methyltransferase [Brucella tritici]KAB2655934.1 hypothetical protein F9K94_15520 [Brucella tritici]
MKNKSSYDVLVVDPPWSYGSNTGRPNRVAEAHYPTIGHNGKEINRNTGKGIEAIVDCAPINDWASRDAHLYLWVTNPKLPFAFEVMKRWGFTYKTTLTWTKTKRDGSVHGGGMGWFFRGATEHILFGVKGNKPIPSSLRVPNVIMAPPTGHSVKPDAFYEMIDGIYSPQANKIDVFARRFRDGWTVWGNEIPDATHPSRGDRHG